MSDLELIGLRRRVAELEAALREAMEWNWGEDERVFVPKRVKDMCAAALTASETKAEPTLICPKCGVNRYRQTCGGPALDCPMHGEPQGEPT